ncbi:MAG TPA: HlyD family type I secretion periplasmic adaptor subunit [Pseudolabrys sp.]|nr:HlyD family type I secretion periplasmic adaptor subunit [Pseudolabrys sp.]
MKFLDHPDTREAIRRYTIAGGAVVLFLTGGVGVWASTMHIAGALIAPGTIVVDSNVKKVQHPTGGVVGEVRVRDGDRVQAGDLLVRLDDTVARANLAIVTKGLTELQARKARLAAERDRADTIKYPDELLQRVNDSDVGQVLAAERKLFELRRAARAGQKAQLRERIEQLGKEINGLSSQQGSKEKEVALIERELTGVRELYQKNLVPITRVTALERDATRLDGERGQLVASIATAKGKIAELNLQVIQVDEDTSSEVAKEMRETDAKIGEFVERKVAAADQLKRTDIIAPQTGTVFQSTVHTVGGVIPAGEPIMLIVPDAEKLAVEARVNPQDIDKVQVGQTAVLRFAAFDARTTPEILGKVTRVSADTATDQRTGMSYYTLRVSLERDQTARLGNVKLVPGMPVDTFVQTGERTVLSYLMKPLSDQIVRAFREK